MDASLWKKSSPAPAADKDAATTAAAAMPRAVAHDSPQPAQTPQFCFSAHALEGPHQSATPRARVSKNDHDLLTQPPSPSPDFLRTSRSAIDDAITEGLNALATPSAVPFDPYAPSSTPSRRSRPLDAPTCSAFRERILFPAWRARSLALEHCARVAAAPDPDDPDAAARAAEAARASARVVNERLDPYSGRFFATESRAERLARRVRQEQMVEAIVRNRSWDVVRSRCGGVDGRDDGWEAAFAAWRGRTDG
jgi:hypothetical protein